jgi:hypothetical protein
MPEYTTVYSDSANQCFWFMYDGEMHSAPWYRHEFTVESVIFMEKMMRDLGVKGYQHSSGGDWCQVPQGTEYYILRPRISKLVNVFEDWTDMTAFEDN